MVTRVILRTLVTATLCGSLTGCGAAGLAAAASTLSLVEQITSTSLKIGDDLVSAVSLACSMVPTGMANEQVAMAAGTVSQSSLPYVWPICGNVSPSNKAINASTPAYVAGVAFSMGKPQATAVRNSMALRYRGLRAE